jgi:cell division septation protein DedD
VNQGLAGLLVGGFIGLLLGLTLAPVEAMPLADLDSPDIACLEDREELAQEVMMALKRMEATHCEEPKTVADGASPRTADAGSPEPGARVRTLIAPDVGLAIAPLVAALQPVGAPDTGSPPESPVVALSPKKKPSVKPPASDGSVTWMVQLIATSDSAEAGRIERRARDLGYAAEITLEEVPAAGESLYKVRVGPFFSKIKGVEALRRIRAKIGITGWLQPRR